MLDSRKPPPSTPASSIGSAMGREQGTREFSFSSADFERVRKLIYQHAGISLSPVKQDMVYSRLARRLRATGTNTFGEYLDLLERGGADEWERFVNSLTTNLTSFFREPHHFPLLADHLNKMGTKRPIRIWCSAASTGEEPYSIAMTVLETCGANVSHVSILRQILIPTCWLRHKRVSIPLSGLKNIAGSPEALFLKGSGSQEGFVSVRPELKRLIEFQRVNLLEPNWPVRGPLDVIFCRNVMIYFDKPTQYKILSRFAPLLQPDGLMFAGHSESFLHAADLFKSLGKTVTPSPRPDKPIKDISAARLR